MCSRSSAHARSVLANGDFGAGKSDHMTDDDGSVQYMPMFSTTCRPHHHPFTGPWVASVDGTTSYEPEIAPRLSGGSFRTTVFQRASYQLQAAPLFVLLRVAAFPTSSQGIRFCNFLMASR
ncbi:hypothetical protein H4582DRAFT_1439174 [Lactarius indigo]|nr:hypothetical protein H4582DRAFT_1439174 [Lactarius indigo]